MSQSQIGSELVPALDYSPHASAVRRQVATIGAYAMHAKHDARHTTAAGRRAFLARFEREVDPEGVLTPDERQRRADQAKNAYMRKLALRSAQKRQGRLQAAPAAKSSPFPPAPGIRRVKARRG